VITDHKPRPTFLFFVCCVVNTHLLYCRSRRCDDKHMVLKVHHTWIHGHGWLFSKTCQPIDMFLTKAISKICLQHKNNVFLKYQTYIHIIFYFLFKLKLSKFTKTYLHLYKGISSKATSPRL